MAGPSPSCLCGQCAKCKKRELMRAYRERHREELNAYRRQWHTEHPGQDAAANRAGRLADPEKWRAYWREHPKSPEYERQRHERRKQQPDWIEKKRDYMRRYRDNYRDHAQAQAKLQDAVRTGRVVRGACEVCGAPGADGHHEDYSKPFVVRWLCRSHHRQLHVALRSA